MKLVRENAILPFTAGEDLSELEGYPVVLENDAIVTCKDGTGEKPLGVLLHGAKQGEQVSVALCVGLAGTVKLALAAAVSAGDRLMMVEYLSAGECAAKRSDSGSRIDFAIALEDGVADELIEAALFNPIYISA